MKYRKLNSHEHVPFNSNPDSLIDAADRLGMEKVVISRPISAESNQLATPQEFKECNDLVLKAIKKHPGRFLGQVFINPIYRKESLEEITRCTDQGMTGLKIYNQVKINDPLFYPIIEKFIDLKMIILVHAHCGLGVGGQRIKYGNIQPNASIPEDFTEAAKRYPEAIFQYAHLEGVEIGNMPARHSEIIQMFTLIHPAAIMQEIWLILHLNIWARTDCYSVQTDHIIRVLVLFFLQS